MSAQSPKTRMQIAEEYGINPKTLTRKLRTRGVRLPPGNIMPADQEIIYTIFGSTMHDLPAAEVKISKETS